MQCDQTSFFREGDLCSGGVPTFTYIAAQLQNGSRPALGFRVVADAPTTTSQRLKALTTGGLSAFVEAGTNFNADNVEEDSLIAALDRDCTVLGDDTWLSMFPAAMWDAPVVFPSFDVRELDANDDGILRHLEEKLLAPVQPRLVVLHFLGVDHAGHRYHAHHHEMHRVIAKLNKALGTLANLLETRNSPKNTMMMVFGDHGMTDGGDHGGDSHDETDTFLFIERFDASRPGMSKDGEELIGNFTLMRRGNCDEENLCRLATLEGMGSAMQRFSAPAVHQVDIVPTVASLLGVPIPYSNVGRLIAEADVVASEYVDGVEDRLRRLLECNVRQVSDYVAKAIGNSTSQVGTTPCNGTMCALHNRLSTLGRRCRAQWASIDETSMAIGIAVLLCGLVFAPFCLFGQLFPNVQFIRSLSNIERFNCVLMFTLVFSRYIAPFANSFAVKEDAIVATVLGTVLVWFCVVAAHSVRQRTRLLVHAACFLLSCHIALFIGARVRYHGTHVAAPMSLLQATALEVPTVMSLTHSISSALPFITALIMVSMLGATAGTRRSYYVTALVVAVVHVLVLDGAFFMHAALLIVIICALVTKGRWRFGFVFRLYAVLWITSLSEDPSKRVCHTFQILCMASLNRLASITVAPALSPKCEHSTNIVSASGNICRANACTLPPYHGFVSLIGVLIHLVGWNFYFAHGMQCIAMINWNAAFVGMKEYNLVVGGLLVFSHSVAPFFITMLMLPPSLDSTAKRKCAFMVMFLQYAELAMATISVCLQRRHLMLWAIFCPKYICDAIVYAVSAMSTLPWMVVA